MPLVGGGRNPTDLVYAERLAESQEQVLDHREPVRPVSIQTGCRAVNKIRWFTANQIRVVKRYIGQMNTNTGAPVATQKLRDRFRFIEDVPLAEEQALLEPVLVAVEDRTNGLECTLKLWRKTGSAVDEDLRQLWSHEFRQVDRLMAYAGAQEVIVDVLGLVEDPEFFGVILDRSGMPLSDLRQRVPRAHWIKNLVTTRARILMWRNIRRLVVGLGLVHGQGLVHGRLNAAAVATEGADTPDFRLGAFEWSLWVRAEAPDRFHAHLESQPQRMAYSFAADWRSLGLLVLELLGVTLSSTGEFEPIQPAAEVDLGLAERRLLKRLVAPARLDLLDAESICHAVDDLIVGIGREMASRAGAFILAFLQRAPLADAVYEASGGEIARDDYQRQLQWVRADIGNGTSLLIPPDFDPAAGSMQLVTASMVYSLRAFYDNGVPRWDIAVCNEVGVRGERLFSRGWQEHALPQPVEVVHSTREATYTSSRLGSGVLDWSAFAGQRGLGAVLDPIDRVRKAMVLVQIIEAFLKALEIYPVEILRRKTTRIRHTVQLRAAPDNDRDSIAQRFGVPDTATALQHLFDDDHRDADGRWRLSESGSLGITRDSDVPARFIDVVDTDRGRVYLFEIADVLPQGNRFYLKTERDRGTEHVIQRRLRNIQALQTRADLVDMLNDPWRARRRGREMLSDVERADAAFQDLDPSKQEALVGLWSTLPSYTVVGPPGVGKTRLATETIRRRFSANRATRMLLTAQGHDALDNLQREVNKTLAEHGLSDLILVRSMTPDSRPTGDEEVHRASLGYLDALASSALVRDAPPILGERVRALISAARTLDRKQDVDKEERSGLKAVSRLLVDAADIVVSTVNSPDVENLVEARDQFDWVIVEEAAKVTGPEMVGALILSGRWLQIGDHHQLPPFQAERYQRVLGDPALIAEMLRVSERSIGSLMRNDELEEMTTLAQDQASLAVVVEQAGRLFEPFRWIATEDDERKRSRPGHRPISHTLNEQRRMDDAIAQIVATFYPEGLKTEARRALAEQSGPTRFEQLAPLPRSPVLVIDFPHVSTSGQRRGYERRGPRWHNPAEVAAVIEVLKHLRARRGEHPTLAVLSPYNAQVDHLKTRIYALLDGELSHLKQFEPVRTAGFVGTVDSFQGSEADLVVLSLVRNNARVGTSALGFLRDRRRLNVAISRAKSQLVIVGSLSFLREAVRGVNPDGDGKHELSFLTAVLNKIDDLKHQQRADGTALATVIAPGWSRSSP